MGARKLSPTHKQGEGHEQSRFDGGFDGVVDCDRREESSGLLGFYVPGIIGFILGTAVLVGWWLGGR